MKKIIFYAIAITSLSQIEKAYAANYISVVKEVFWVSRFSRGAHESCFELVKDIEYKFMELAKKNCSDYGEANRAHIDLVKAIEQEIIEPSDSESIKDYIEKNGNKDIAKLISREAAKI